MHQIIQPGIIEVYAGPMKSGKTKKIIDRVMLLDYMNPHEIFFFNPAVNTRQNLLVSRSSQRQYAWQNVDEQNPYALLGIITQKTEIVVIDEAQFFSNDLMQVVERMARSNINVLLAGLDTDFRGEPFGCMPYLLSIADYVEKMTAVCDFPNCEKPATRTQRLIHGNPAPYDAPLILIGDAEHYQARCLDHHLVPGKKI
ncbi:thymidine kinase [Candidatus Woesearchaeota archaeon]|nr:MAG: thymidine kinase [Candidatus Woesearchaeota archaeon]